VFIIYGWGKNLKNLGFIIRAYCHPCKKDTDASVSAVYKFFSLFFLPIIAFGAKYIGKCSECGSESELDKSKLSHKSLGSPIPIWQRFGFVIMAGIIALVVVIVNVASGPTVVSIAGNIEVSNGDSATNYVAYAFLDGEDTTDHYCHVEADGDYSFNNLPSGGYGIYICTVSQAESTSYTFEGPAAAYVTVTDGETSEVTVIQIE